MTSTMPTTQQLLDEWRTETAEHANTLRHWTELALRGVQDSDGIAIAEQLTLKGVETTSDETGAPIYGRARVERGPFVRVYDTTGNHGDGTYVWAKGNVLIPDHAIETVVMARQGTWARVTELAAAWPVEPCGESLATYPTSDADDAETDADRAEANYCPSCEHYAPFQRVDGVGWVRAAHRRNGTPIEL